MKTQGSAGVHLALELAVAIGRFLGRRIERRIGWDRVRRSL